MDIPDVTVEKAVRRIWVPIAGFTITLSVAISLAFIGGSWLWWSGFYFLLSPLWVYILYRVAMLIHLEGQLYAMQDMAKLIPANIWPWWPDD